MFFCQFLPFLVELEFVFKLVLTVLAPELQLLVDQCCCSGTSTLPNGAFTEMGTVGINSVEPFIGWFNGYILLFLGIKKCPLDNEVDFI